MSKYQLSKPLFPKNGRVLRVLIVARISGDNQQMVSLEAQENMLKPWVQDRYDGSVEFIVIAGKGSGEILDREEAIRIELEAASGKYDLVIAEDLGRIYRRLHALLFCETCLDTGTRVIAVNDHVDTAVEGWKLHGIFAVMRHESYNEDTSKRIRRSHRDSFVKGGIIPTLQYGYIKPEGAKHDSMISKDPAAERVYDKWFEMLESGASFSEIADWLNENGISPGKYARQEKWDCAMVSRHTRNPILKGVRVRNRKISVRVEKTGRHKQINATADLLLERPCPHLAFIDAERYDRVVAMIKRRNSCFRRTPVDGQDPRANVPKKRTRFPGQHIYCGCCGSLMVYGAHGQADRLICSDAKHYHCWMSVSVDGPMTKELICVAVEREMQQLPEFTSELLQAVEKEARSQAELSKERAKGIERALRRLDSAAKRLMDSIKEYGASKIISAELAELEQQREMLVEDHEQALAAAATTLIEVPSVAEVHRRVGDALRSIVENDPAASRLLRSIISKITVYPYRSVDGGHIVLRAKFSINFAGIHPGLTELVSVGHPWMIPVQIDLFHPAQRQQIREDVSRLSESLTQLEMMTVLKVTRPVIQQAVRLQKLMDEMGVNDPYQPISEPPPDYKKLCRYLHPRFGSKPAESDELHERDELDPTT